MIVCLFRPFWRVVTAAGVEPARVPRFTTFRAYPLPLSCIYRAHVARLLFGITMPTRHAVTFAALARVVVSSVSAPLFAFVPILSGGLLAPRLRFSLRYYLRLSPAFVVCNPAGGAFREPRLVWGLVVRSLAPPCPRRLPLAVCFRCFYCFQRGGYVSEKRRKINKYIGKKICDAGKYVIFSDIGVCGIITPISFPFSLLRPLYPPRLFYFSEYRIKNFSEN